MSEVISAGAVARGNLRSTVEANWDGRGKDGRWKSIPKVFHSSVFPFVLRFFQDKVLRSRVGLQLGPHRGGLVS